MTVYGDPRIRDEPNTGTYMSKKYSAGIGLALGLCFGVVLGMLLDNLGLGIALGLLAGITFDILGTRKKNP